MKDKNLEILNSLFEISKNVEPIDGARIAAAVVYRNKIISVGICQRKTDPFQAEYAPNEHAIYIHAEVHAIKQAKKLLSPKQLEKSSVFVSRSIIAQKNKGKKVHKEYQFGLAKPCEGCSRCIAAHGIARAIYTTYEGYEVKLFNEQPRVSKL